MADKLIVTKTKKVGKRVIPVKYRVPVLELTTVDGQLRIMRRVGDGKGDLIKHE